MVLSVQHPDATPSGERGLEALLDSYHHVAADVLNAHVRAGEHCTDCGQVWPCEPVNSAAFALDL
ncbi:hypothetical protein [Kutzneria chonburiensis]|jgi:hypothetical protein|uniref:Uncharacterized protein n=1 Tax=Kutzneria chonburiensis TaxID=1483604 RepID=A0ABV6N8U2_9PSEU|nr:hypothetical protein [Kutzneria chonburiensis]